MTILVWGIGPHTRDIAERLQEVYGVSQCLQFGDILIFVPDSSGKLPATLSLLVDMLESEYIRSFTIYAGGNP